jgi:dGTP triphosphohydrolase
MAVNSNYTKQLYKKNTNWNPPPASLIIEEQFTNFEKLLQDTQSQYITKYKTTKLHNLTTIQQKALKELKNNKQLIIKPTDINLGPALMELDTYIQQVLCEHLLTQDYIQLTKQEATARMDALKQDLKLLIKTNETSLPQAEVTFFNHSLKTRFRLPIFYGLPKVHKTPMSL